MFGSCQTIWNSRAHFSHKFKCQVPEPCKVLDEPNEDGWDLSILKVAYDFSGAAMSRNYLSLMGIN